MRSSVKRGFLTVAFGAAAAVSAVVSAPLAVTSVLGWGLSAVFGFSFYMFLDNAVALLPVRMPKGTSAPLSDDEIKLFKSVFGRKVADADIKKIRKYMEPSAESAKVGTGRAPTGSTLAAVFNRRVVKFYGAGQHAQDYSVAKAPLNFGAFLHEMTHIWQKTRATASFSRAVFRSKEYSYALTKRSRFSFFGEEQQASIVQDYALRFLYPHGDVPAQWIATTPENDALLQRVVERKFPAAGQARLALAEKKRAQATPEEREKFLRAAGSDVIETLNRWTREPGSAFRFRDGIVDADDKSAARENAVRENAARENAVCLGIDTESPYALMLLRNGRIILCNDTDERLDFIGTVEDVPAALAPFRARLEEAGVLQKKQAPERDSAPSAPAAPTCV